MMGCRPLCDSEEWNHSPHKWMSDPGGQAEVKKEKNFYNYSYTFLAYTLHIYNRI
jgi:hypothetical protein